MSAVKRTMEIGREYFLERADRDIEKYRKGDFCITVLKDGKPFVKLYASLSEKGNEEEKKNIITEVCEKNLSKFSVPREIEFLDELPHTPLEKVDFMALEKKT